MADWNNRNDVLRALSQARQSNDSQGVELFSQRLDELPAPQRDWDNADSVRTAFVEARMRGDATGEQQLGARLQELERELYNPTSGMSGVEKLVAGTSKSVMDAGRGLRQLSTDIGNVVGLGRLAPASFGDHEVARQRAEQSEIDARDAPLMATGAGTGGAIAGALASTLLPASLITRGAQLLNMARTAEVGRQFVNPTTYRAAAGAGAAQGALQPVGTRDSRAENMLVGGVLGAGGNAVANTAGRIAQPIRRALNPQERAAVRVLDDAGVPLDVVQRSGSKAAEVAKRAVSDNPFTSPGQAQFIDQQQRAFTRAVLRTLGENADVATPDVMDRAATRIGNVFDDVAARNPVRVDSQLNNELAQLWQDSARELPSPEAAVIQRQIEEIASKVNDGVIDGNAYQNLRTSLGRVSSQRSPLGYWAGELRATIDDALQRSARPADMAALREARQQYRRMLQIEGAIDNEGGGIISASKLANTLSAKGNRRQSKYGRGDQQLLVLAQAGKKLLPDKFPNSGTPARIAGQLAIPSVLGLGTGYATGDPMQGLGVLALSAGALRGVRGALNNQQIARYLTEGMPAGRTRNAFAQLAGSGVMRHAPAVAGLEIEEQR